MTGSLSISRRGFMQLSIGGAAAMLGTPAMAAGAAVVVELFTHQGCESCPPADALLRELSQRADVIALSLHVNYWDYLGWRDTLGSPDCAARQRAYARRRGDGQVYTPQVVINGEAAVVGSDRQAIVDAIDRARADRTFVPLSLASRARELIIEVPAAPRQRLPVEATVWVVSVEPQVVTEIRRGQNAGRTFSYTNVVRKIIPAGMWHGDELTLSLPKAAVLSDASSCAALLQVDGTGPIIGSGWISADSA